MKLSGTRMARVLELPVSSMAQSPLVSQTSRDEVMFGNSLVFHLNIRLGYVFGRQKIQKRLFLFRYLLFLSFDFFVDDCQTANHRCQIILDTLGHLEVFLQAQCFHDIVLLFDAYDLCFEFFGDLDEELLLAEFVGVEYDLYTFIVFTELFDALHNFLEGLLLSWQNYRRITESVVEVANVKLVIESDLFDHLVTVESEVASVKNVS